jgi:large subunit ribosomal protein L22
MEAQATAKFIRYAPRKVNQVLTLIRNKKVEKAFEILSFLPKSATEVVSKVLKSAAANSGKLSDLGSIKVKEAWVGYGPRLKRMRPGPMGRGMPYKRETSHLTIVVTNAGVEADKKKKSAAPKVKKAVAAKKSAPKAAENTKVEGKE